MTKVYRYEGFYYLSAGDDSCWVALLGGTEYARGDLEKLTPEHNSPEQMEEVRKALVELPGDSVKPTKAQKRKIVPTEGYDEEV